MRNKGRYTKTHHEYSKTTTRSIRIRIGTGKGARTKKNTKRTQTLIDSCEIKKDKARNGQDG
jgi:hypothetical protein